MMAVCSHCNGTGELPDNRETGAAMRAKRALSGVSQNEAAKRMGISGAYLSDLERGTRNWNPSIIRRFEEAIS